MDDSRCMRFASWINKSTDTNSEYVTFIAVAQQQWLREGDILLHNIYISCVVNLVPSKSKVFKVVQSHYVDSEFFLSLPHLKLWKALQEYYDCRLIFFF